MLEIKCTTSTQYKLVFLLTNQAKIWHSHEIMLILYASITLYHLRLWYIDDSIKPFVEITMVFFLLVMMHGYFNGLGFHIQL